MAISQNTFAVALCILVARVQGQETVKTFADLGGKPYDVSYNGRSMLVGGKSVLLLSGSVHYTRSTPEMWPSIFAKMKASGLNCIESYVFWNYHIPDLASHNSNTPDYTGRGNVTLFLQLAAEADLFVIWRIGPYICAEWPNGGMPDWLRQIPGMKARSPTQPYQDVCFNWMHRHIEYVRPFFAENGGPIIMTQMENELSGPSDTPYVEWLGQLATELKTNLPWIMCHGAHANDTIETCNGCDCTDFVPGLVAQNQPAMWSEDEQWFDRFTQGAAVRHTGDVGRGVAKFIAVGGSMHNFYMFHGGTMWGNWSTTVRRTRLTPSYANSANLASDTIVYNPKYSKIAELHWVLANNSDTILHTPAPMKQVAVTGITPACSKVWTTTHKGAAGDSAITFLVNDCTTAVSFTFMAKARAMAAASALILDHAGEQLWYSDTTEIDGTGEPYRSAGVALKWTSWSDSNDSTSSATIANSDQGVRSAAAASVAASVSDGGAAGERGVTGGGGGGTWYRTSFARPQLPAGAQVSFNLTGFGQGNLFINGVHVVYFNLENGECFHAPGGVNGHGSCFSYILERCDKPTQDCYHVPPEWIHDQNEVLVWSDSKLPANVTAIAPELASVVYRVDPPAVRQQVEAFLASKPAMTAHLQN